MPHRILIVEDDPLVAMMLEAYIEALGGETIGSAEDLAGALAKVADRDFDAAIIDVHLANGETSEPVAAALKAANIPFIICTGSGESADPRYADAPFLAKPVTLARLGEALSALSQTRAPLTQQA